MISYVVSIKYIDPKTKDKKTKELDLTCRTVEFAKRKTMESWNENSISAVIKTLVEMPVCFYSDGKWSAEDKNTDRRTEYNDGQFIVVRDARDSFIFNVVNTLTDQIIGSPFTEMDYAGTYADRLNEINNSNNHSQYKTK